MGDFPILQFIRVVPYHLVQAPAIYALQGPQHLQQQQSLMDAEPVQQPAPSQEELIAQLQPQPQVELQLGPQEIQVRQTAEPDAMERCTACPGNLAKSPSPVMMVVQAHVVCLFLCLCICGQHSIYPSSILWC